MKLELKAPQNFYSDKFSVLVDPSPYQVVEETPLAQIYHMLTMLSVDRVYVICGSTLVGEITSEYLLGLKL